MYPSDYAITWSADGKTVVGTNDTHLFQWDARGGTERHPTREATSSVWQLAVNPDGPELLASFAGGAVTTWSLGTWKENSRLPPFGGHLIHARAVGVASAEGVARQRAPRVGPLQRTRR